MTIGPCAGVPGGTTGVGEVGLPLPRQALNPKASAKTLKNNRVLMAGLL